MVNDGWKVNQAEFKGFVKAKLETHGRELGEIKGIIKDFCSEQRDTNFGFDTRMDKMEQTQSRWKGFMAGISIVGGVLGGVLKGLIGK